MTRTKIAFATDIHGCPRIYSWVTRAVKTSDIVMLGGDIASLGDRGLDMTERLVSMAIRAGNMTMVLGNHDWPIAMEERGILHGTTTNIAGLTIGGVGGSLPVGGWPFELDESEYEILFKKMGPVDVLLCHEPPIDTRCDINWNDAHCGSTAVYKYIEETQPRLACFGHIHESRAVDKIGKTVLVNPGDFYGGCSASIVIDGDRVSPRLNYRLPPGAHIR